MLRTYQDPSDRSCCGDCCSETDFLAKIGVDVPLFFGSIGAAFDMSGMPKESILKNCAIIIIGLFFRLPTALMAIALERICHQKSAPLLRWYGHPRRQFRQRSVLYRSK